MTPAPLNPLERFIFFFAACGLLLAAAITYRAPGPPDDFHHPIPRRRM